MLNPEEQMNCINGDSTDNLLGGPESRPGSSFDKPKIMMNSGMFIVHKLKFTAVQLAQTFHKLSSIHGGSWKFMNGYISRQAVSSQSKGLPNFKGRVRPSVCLVCIAYRGSIPYNFEPLPDISCRITFLGASSLGSYNLTPPHKSNLHITWKA